MSTFSSVLACIDGWISHLSLRTGSQFYPFLLVVRPLLCFISTKSPFKVFGKHSDQLFSFKKALSYIDNSRTAKVKGWLEVREIFLKNSPVLVFLTSLKTQVLWSQVWFYTSSSPYWQHWKIFWFLFQFWEVLAYGFHRRIFFYAVSSYRIYVLDWYQKRVSLRCKFWFTKTNSIHACFKPSMPSYLRSLKK